MLTKTHRSGKCSQHCEMLTAVGKVPNTPNTGRCSQYNGKMFRTQPGKYSQHLWVFLVLQKFPRHVSTCCSCKHSPDLCPFAAVVSIFKVFEHSPDM